MDNDISLWIARLDNVPHEPLRDLFLDRISRHERDRYQSFVHEATRHVYLLAHALLRVALSDRISTSIENLRFQTDCHGKPHLAEGTCPRAAFSISHAPGIAVCAIACNTPIGVDVEPIARGPDLEGIAIRFLNVEEQKRLVTCRQEDRGAELVSLWTCKEALLKASGRGLKEPMTNICLSEGTAGMGVVWSGSTQSAWDLLRFCIKNEFVGALAVPGRTDVLRRLHVCTAEGVELRATPARTVLAEDGILQITP